MPKILSGAGRIALAITEPDAGSDVQGLQTEAILSDDGSHFVVNGMKKVFCLVTHNAFVSAHDGHLG